MYEVYISYTEWRGGDYNGWYCSESKRLYFKSEQKAIQFAEDVNNKKEFTWLEKARAYPPKLIVTQD